MHTAAAAARDLHASGTLTWLVSFGKAHGMAAVAFAPHLAMDRLPGRAVANTYASNDMGCFVRSCAMEVIRLIREKRQR